MRELVNFDSGERLGLSVEDKALVSVSLKCGKTKQTKKEFASEQDAKKACAKKEWESLKKGFILQDSEAKAGAASLHVYIGGGYTGALSFASVRDEIYIFEPKEAKFRQISVEQNLKRNNEIASFICASNNVAIFGMFGQIFAFRDGEISKIGEYKCIEKSYAPILCATLSADASMLALCTKENEVQILNAKNGEILSEARAEFGALDKICFLDDETLLVRKHLENKLFCLDIKSAKVTKQPWIKDEYLRASEFCIDAVAGKLVVIDQSRAYATNLQSGDVMAEFTLDHVVKSCEAKFVDGKLAVRTDYGCFSLYEI